MKIAVKKSANGEDPDGSKPIRIFGVSRIRSEFYSFIIIQFPLCHSASFPR